VQGQNSGAEEIAWGYGCTGGGGAGVELG